MGRAQTILARLPAHLEPSRPGKLLGQVAAALARDLDVQSAQLAAIRRAHRLFDADELTDLLFIAARHGVGAPSLAILTLRFERAGERRQILGDAAEVGARNDAAAALLALWGIDAPEPKLALFADAPEGGGPPDLEGQAGEIAVQRLTAALDAALARRAFVAAARTRVTAVVAVHADGNGTVRALLGGAANVLDLDIGPMHSSADRYLHAAFGRDRLDLRGTTPERVIQTKPAREVIGLEENPRYRVETDTVPRRHAELFDQLRRGFERATLRIAITGEGERTHGPMLVNRDEGHGVGYAGQVPAGETLVLDEDGRVTLGELDVTPFAYAWRGACFADGDRPHPNDFVFADPAQAVQDRVAGFAVGLPEHALDPSFEFPHAGDSLPMPGVAVGRTRFAFFVQEAYFSVGALEPDLPHGRRVPPRPAVGFFDGSVFAPGAGEARSPAAQVSLSWLERKAHFVRILIPPRFRQLEDDPEAPEVRRRLAEAVNRFKPAGVAVEVDFIDDRWTLGEGVLTAADAEDPVAVLRGGTVLWEPPETP
jgi:hypothetical protein